MGDRSMRDNGAETAEGLDAIRRAQRMTATAPNSVRLRDALRDPSPRGREIETAIALAMQRVVANHKLDAKDAIRGLTGNLVAVVFARTTGLAEAREVGEEVCAELMRRLTAH